MAKKIVFAMLIVALALVLALVAAMPAGASGSRGPKCPVAVDLEMVGGTLFITNRSNATRTSWYGQAALEDSGGVRHQAIGPFDLAGKETREIGKFVGLFAPVRGAYTATITWGDGKTSTCRKTFTGQGYVVTLPMNMNDR